MRNWKFLLMRLPQPLASAGLAWILLAPALAAQITTGRLTGVVLDPAARPIATARVRLAAPGVDRETATGPAGEYRFTGLKPGAYRLTITAGAFAERTINDIAITVNGQTHVDATLALQPLATSVESTAPPGRDAAELGLVIAQRDLAGLPLNRRDFLQLALLAPGVTPPVEGSQLSQKGGFALHANGAREEFNNFLLDGMDNNDPQINRYALQPPVDAIQEFKIATNGFSAEYGRAAGAQVNAVTRSGGEQFHGFLYDYFRHRHLDARNFFSGASKPHFVRHQFGGGVGGPVRRERTFFFVNADGLRERRGLPRLGTVPGVAERTGDFSGVSGAAPLDPFTRQPFPGRLIPPSRQHPLAARVLALFPAPNRAGAAAGNLFAQPVLDATQSQANARLDHRLGPRAQLTARYSFGHSRLFEPYSQDSVNVPGFGDRVRDAGHNVMVQHQYTPNAALVNSFLAGFNGLGRRVLPENAATNVNALWGVNWLPAEALRYGFPVVNIAGYSSVGDASAFPIDRTARTWQATDTLAWQHGAHTTKFGAELRRIRHAGVQDLLTRGSLTFSGALSGNGLADALLGLPSLGIQAQADNYQRLGTTAVNLFAQDEWRVHARLTLHAGVRYEYNTPPTDPDNRMSTLSGNQVVRVGQAGVPRSGLQPDRNNFAPRVGLAWRAPGEVTVRAGYGVYYDSGLLVANTALYFNPPFFAIRVYFPTAQALLNLSDPFRGGITPPASLSALSPALRGAYLQQWNFTIEQRGFSVAYAGSKGTGLLRSRDVNQPLPGPGDIGARRPNPALGNVFFTESAGNSTYHSLQLNYQRPLRRGWSALASYTYSKAIDDASAFLGTRADKNFPQNSRDLRSERGLSSFDQRQRLSAAAVWQWRHGIEWSAVAAAASGSPFTPVLRFDNSNTGNTGGQFGSDRPSALRSASLAQPTPQAWFDTAAFALAPRYSFGNAGRSILTGPAFASVDTSLAKRWTLRDRLTLRLEGQVFNLLNRANFDWPERLADEPTTFGRIFSAKAPRQAQLALRVIF